MRRLMILWVVSLAVTAAISAGLAAQAQSGRADSRILSGGDIGFRVEGQKREVRTNPSTGGGSAVDVLTGQLVVRVNGQWVDVAISGVGVRPATN